MIQDLVLFGAGGMGREMLAVLKDINQAKPTYRLVAYIVDDEYYQKDQIVWNIPVKNKEWLLKQRDDVVCCCAMGYPKQRRKVQKELMSAGIRFANIIHPTAEITSGSQIGSGCILWHSSGVSIDCKLGDGVFLSTYALVGHDVVIEDYVTCFPKSQISGKVQVGEAACIGSMSFIQERIKIGKEAIVAPGSIVFANVKKQTHVMGNPAKRIELF